MYYNRELQIWSTDGVTTVMYDRNTSTLVCATTHLSTFGAAATPSPSPFTTTAVPSTPAPSSGVTTTLAPGETASPTTSSPLSPNGSSIPSPPPPTSTATPVNTSTVAPSSNGTTAAPNGNAAPGSPSGVSSGAVAGIVIGVIIAVLVVVAIVFVLKRQRGGTGGNKHNLNDYQEGSEGIELSLPQEAAVAAPNAYPQGNAELQPASWAPSPSYPLKQTNPINQLV